MSKNVRQAENAAENCCLALFPFQKVSNRKATKYNFYVKKKNNSQN